MAIIVTCKRGGGDREAPPINDSLIINEYMATLRGKRFLDDPGQGGYYSAKARSLKFRHKGASVVPGSWITVSDSHLGLDSTKLKVKSYSITITPTAVWAQADTETYAAVTR